MTAVTNPLIRRAIRRNELRETVPLADGTIYEMDQRGELGSVASIANLSIPISKCSLPSRDLFASIRVGGGAALWRGEPDRPTEIGSVATGEYQRDDAKGSETNHF